MPRLPHLAPRNGNTGPYSIFSLGPLLVLHKRPAGKIPSAESKLLLYKQLKASLYPLKV